ncbi:lysophospholipase L1-like esterase [Rhabdobacter roseus]|uniref:Lysophospholipase L1-like esterase n=1 Tax=Rhabdobacter roseus TaxID=1655419 RepID=A0A840TM11_9BACT|nr:GDSL-type esterase/lipase family protein [Rhabdobacter roseus]MBB5282807.1 lysophospholipase L1-like esterase [Rhabdobacter roseus]
MKKYLLILLVAFVACHRPHYASLSTPWTPNYALDRFEGEIKNFEAQDAAKMPAPSGIVLTGSSSFKYWKTAEQDLAPLPVINRGFGGSTLSEVLHYADRAILKYQPKTVVIYCENDLFMPEPKSAEQTRDAYVALTKHIRAKLPHAQLYYVAMKPSPSRWDRREEVQRTNELIKAFVRSDKRHEYVDVWPVMLKDGRPDGRIFVKDSLHMNAEGYRRWTQVLKPILEKDTK